MNENINNNINGLTHGLLTEDFKQNLMNLVTKHQLDIQTKAIIIDAFSMQLQSMSKQQTELELQEYKKAMEIVEKEKKKEKEKNEENKEKSKINESKNESSQIIKESSPIE